MSSGSGVCQVHVDDLDHLKWHKPSIFRQLNCSLVTPWVPRPNSSPGHHRSEDLGKATILLRKKAPPCSWLLLSARRWCFAITALSHGKGVHSAPGCSHAGYLCFPVSLSTNVSLLEWHVERTAVKEQNTEVATSGRDVVALEKISDHHIRPEFVVMLVFVARQSFNSRH